MNKLMRMRTLLWSIAVVAIAVTAVVRRQVYDRFSIHPNGRVIEARVTAFYYAPPRSLRSGDVAASNQELFNELELRLHSARTPENVHRYALAEIASGKTRSARDLLIEASRLQPANAGILSDLAAAQLALGDVAEAAETCGRALRVDPSNPSAVFNWALALEKLSVRPVAIEAWERFLTLDRFSGWADEARQHLAELRRPRATYRDEARLLQPGVDIATVERVVSRFPQRARGFAQNYILPRWLKAEDPRDLILMRNIAQTRAKLGDPYLLEIVEHAAAHRETMKASIVEFTAARAEEEKQQWGRASEHFAKAAELLAHCGSPLAIGASIYAAQGEFTIGRNKVALERLKSVDERLASTGKRYPTMAAESAWVRAMIVGRMGEPQESLDAYRYAVSEAKRGGETEHVAAITSMIAWVFENVGDRNEADRARLEALRLNDDINAASDRMYASYLDAAFVALRTGRPHLALAFTDAMLPIAQKEKHPVSMAEVEAWRALGFVELGDVDAARASIQAARADAMRVPVETMRDFTLANIDYTEGRLEEQTHPERAVLKYSSAIDLWQRHDWRFETARAFFGRGEAELRRGNAAAAERDFRAGIAEMEKQRAGIDQPAVRVTFFERSGDLFDHLIELLLNQGRADDALSVLERRKARVLLEQMAANSGAEAAPLDAAGIAAAVRGPLVIVEIALSAKNVELWTIRSGAVKHVRSAASRAELERAIADHLSAIATNDSASIQRSGRWLYEQLLAPALGPVAENVDLVVAGDGELESFPFATLVAPDGKYLIDHLAVASAPSASVFLRSNGAANVNSVLAVAEPMPSGFDVLTNVEREVRAIGRLYPRGQVRVGTQVTPAEFLDAASRASIVHFGGHATAEIDEPASSSLIFQTSGEAARLTVREISRSKLVSHPLVVLAACSTAKGKLRRTEGIDSLASAFLRAGARGVAATLWDIDDEASLRLFTDFHKNLRAGARPIEALRHAQRVLLHGQDERDRNPLLWGGVTLIGTL